MNIRLFILFFIAITNFVNNKCPFPKTIWLYWDQPQYKLPLIPKLCYNQILKHASKSHFQVILLNQQNLHSYISQYKVFRQIVSKSVDNYRANYADFIRLTILQEHGGIWMNITAIITQGFEWLDNLQNQTMNIFNKYGQAQRQPDVLMFFNPVHGHRPPSQPQQSAKSNFLPGYQSWFIGSKKNSELIRDWRNKYIQYYLLQNLQIIDNFVSNQININHYGSGSYYRVFYAILYVIQQKQKELDIKLNIFGRQRINANIYYKIWTLNCHLGPCLSYQNYLNPWGPMSRDTLKQLQYLHRYPIRYFVKLQHERRENANTVVQQQINLYNNNITLKKQLQNKPWYECSQINYIVEGSVLGILLEQNKQIQKAKIQSIEQRQQWKQYCEKIEKNKFDTNKIRQYVWAVLFYFFIFFITWKLVKIDQNKEVQTTNKKENQSLKKYQQTTQKTIKKFIFYHLCTFCLSYLLYYSVNYAYYLDFKNTKNQVFKSFFVISLTLICDYFSLQTDSINRLQLTMTIQLNRQYSKSFRNLQNYSQQFHESQQLFQGLWILFFGKNFTESG